MSLSTILKGYAVRLEGRSGVVYEEKGRTLVLQGEMLVDDPKYDFVIYGDSPMVWTHSGAKVSDEELEIVRERVDKWFRGRVEWSWPVK